MRNRTISSVRNSCDKLWSLVVRSMGHCEKCGAMPPAVKLDPHHVYGRRDLRLRWNIRNGCCLCFTHHRWAEENPIEFTKWFERYRVSDTAYLAEERRKGTLTGLEKRTLPDYLELEAELKEEAERLAY